MLKIEFCDALDVWSFSKYFPCNPEIRLGATCKIPSKQKGCKNVRPTRREFRKKSTDNSGGFTGWFLRLYGMADSAKVCLSLLHLESSTRRSLRPTVGSEVRQIN